MYSPFPQRWRWSRALSLRLHIPTSSQSPVDNDWGEKPCRKQLSRAIYPDLVCSEVNFFYCFNLFCCAVGLSFTLFCSIAFRIPNTTGFEVSRSTNCFWPISVCFFFLFCSTKLIFTSHDGENFYIANGIILTKWFNQSQQSFVRELCNGCICLVWEN